MAVLMTGKSATSKDHRRRQDPDVDYLDALAKRLAHAAGLPLDLAEARVRALAVSTKTRGESKPIVNAR